MCQYFGNFCFQLAQMFSLKNSTKTQRTTITTVDIKSTCSRILVVHVIVFFENTFKIGQTRQVAVYILYKKFVGNKTQLKIYKNRING